MADMSMKERILSALRDVELGDLDEGRLMDILLDTLHVRDAQIQRLESANGRERHDILQEREHMKAELHKMRSDPLYCAGGEFFFTLEGRRLWVLIQGSKIDLFERRDNIDRLAQRVPTDEWHTTSGK